MQTQTPSTTSPPPAEAAGARRGRSWAYLSRRAWPIWATVALVSIVSRLWTPATPGNVYNIYLEAARSWTEGRPLYEVHGFYYFPTAALAFVPLEQLPFVVGGALWRTVNLLLLAFGTFCFTRDCSGSNRPRAWFPLVSLVVAALSHSCVRHGQVTLAMAGLMLFAASSLQRGRWLAAGVALAGAVAAKPLAIVLALVAPALYPRVIPYLAAAGAAFFVLPFACQDFDYAWAQYAAVPEMLRGASNREADEVFYQLPELLETLGLQTSLAARTGMRAVFAVLTLAGAWLVHRRCDPRRRGFFLFGVAACYILLFGAGTERNTYALLAPGIALLLVRALETGQRFVAWLLGALTTATVLLSSTLSRAFPGSPIGMLKVWVCLAFLALMLRDLRSDPPGPATAKG